MHSKWYRSAFGGYNIGNIIDLNRYKTYTFEEVIEPYKCSPPLALPLYAYKLNDDGRIVWKSIIDNEFVRKIKISQL